MRWRDYQEDVAEFFRELGCDAEVDAQVQGTRASHKVDVWVTFHRFGLEHKNSAVLEYNGLVLKVTALQSGVSFTSVVD